MGERGLSSVGGEEGGLPGLLMIRSGSGGVVEAVGGHEDAGVGEGDGKDGGAEEEVGEAEGVEVRGEDGASPFGADEGEGGEGGGGDAREALEEEVVGEGGDRWEGVVGGRGRSGLGWLGLGLGRVGVGEAGLDEP